MPLAINGWHQPTMVADLKSLTLNAKSHNLQPNTPQTPPHDDNNSSLLIAKESYLLRNNFNTVAFWWSYMHFASVWETMSATLATGVGAGLS